MSEKRTKIKISKEIEIDKEDYEYLREFLFKYGICKSEKCVRERILEYYLEEDKEEDEEFVYRILNYKEDDFY